MSKKKIDKKIRNLSKIDLNRFIRVLIKKIPI